MGLTAPIFLLIPVGITPALIFFLDTQMFSRPQRIDYTCILLISPVQMLSYVYEYIFLVLRLPVHVCSCGT